MNNGSGIWQQKQALVQGASSRDTVCLQSEANFIEPMEDLKYKWAALNAKHPT